MIKIGDFICLKRNIKGYETPFKKVIEVKDNQVRISDGPNSWVDIEDVYNCRKMPKVIMKFLDTHSLKPFDEFIVSGWATKFYIDNEGTLWNEHTLSQDTSEHTMFKLLTNKLNVFPTSIPKCTTYYYYDGTEDKIKSAIFHNTQFDIMAILAQNFFLTYNECEAAKNQIKANLIKLGSEIHDRL